MTTAGAILKELEHDTTLCPRCHGRGRIPLSDVQANRKRAGKLYMEKMYAIRQRAVKAGYTQVEVRESPRSAQHAQLSCLRLYHYDMHPELGPAPAYSDYDPWGAHTPPRDVLERVFGHDEARAWGRRLFNADFEGETV